MKSITALLLSVALFNGALCRSVPYGAYNNYQSSGYDTGIEEGSAVVDASGSIPPSEVPVEIGSGSGSGMDTPFFGPEDCSTLSDGLYPMSACSHQFLTCSGGIARVMDCPASLYYNAAVEACDWAESVGCPAEDVPMVPETVEGSTSGNGYKTVQEPATPVVVDTPAEDTPMEASGNNNYGSVKAEVKPTHVVEPTKPTPVQDQPMAASGNYNYGGVKVETPVPTPTIEKPIVVAPEADKPTPASGYNKVTPTVAPSTVVDVPAPRAYDTYEAVTATPVTPPPMHDEAYGSYRASPSMDAVDLDCSSRPDGLYSLGQCSTQFLTCSGGIARVMDCPASLIYRSVIEACDWPENAGCA